MVGTGRRGLTAHPYMQKFGGIKITFPLGKYPRLWREDTYIRLHFGFRLSRMLVGGILIFGSGLLELAHYMCSSKWSRRMLVRSRCIDELKLWGILIRFIFLFSSRTSVCILLIAYLIYPHRSNSFDFSLALLLLPTLTLDLLRVDGWNALNVGVIRGARVLDCSCRASMGSAGMPTTFNLFWNVALRAFLLLGDPDWLDRQTLSDLDNGQLSTKWQAYQAFRTITDCPVVQESVFMG